MIQFRALGKLTHTSIAALLLIVAVAPSAQAAGKAELSGYGGGSEWVPTPAPTATATPVPTAIATPQPTPLPTAAPIVDLCPDDAAKLAPGACGCGIEDADSNSNSIFDCLVGAEFRDLLRATFNQIRKLKTSDSIRAWKLQRALHRAIKQNASQIRSFSTLFGSRIQLNSSALDLTKLSRKASKQARRSVSAQVQSRLVVKRRAQNSLGRLYRSVVPEVLSAFSH